MSSKDKKTRKSKHRLLKFMGFGLLFAAVTATAIVLPIEINKNKKLSLNFNHSTNTLEGNKNRINFFIDTFLQDNKYNLPGSLEVNGKDGVLGTTGESLSSSQRSMITVSEAYDLNLFSLKLKSPVLYALRQNKIKYELAYVKPYYSDSSYPVVGIKLYYGSGADYYETIYEYRDTDLYGFKKTVEQTMLETYVNQIEDEPNSYFELISSVGKIGDIGIYAKNIKTSDINLNSPKLQELRKNNVYVSISSVEQNEQNPSMLKVVYTITYNDGNITNSISSQEVYVGPFDVEQGSDDPKSKLKNFISDNKEWINNLSQYFEYSKPKDDKNIYSVREAYEKGFINFNITSSIKNKLDNEGIEVEFKKFADEQKNVANNPNELSAFNYEFDSTTPVYRLYFTSYPNTPLAYTEYVDIVGVSQEGDFAKSDEQLKMEAIYNYLQENNMGFENVFDFDQNSSNPLSLSNYFLSNNITYQNGKYNLPFQLVSKLYSLYNENKNNVENQYEKPFDNFVFIEKNVSLPTSWSYEGQTFNLSQIVQEILSTINDKSNGDFEFQLDSISEGSTVAKSSMDLNICLGSTQKGTLFTNVEPLRIYIDNYFKTEQEYEANILKNIAAQINSNNVIIQMTTTNEAYFRENFEQRNFDKLFSSANVYNIPENTIPFPDLQSQLKIEINMNYFNSLTKAEIQQCLDTTTINIQIKISFDNSSNLVNITKTINELLEK